MEDNSTDGQVKGIGWVGGGKKERGRDRREGEGKGKKKEKEERKGSGEEMGRRGSFVFLLVPLPIIPNASQTASV